MTWWVDREARGADRAQHGVAQFGAVVEVLGIGGLEQQAAKPDRLEQHAIARLERDIIDMAGIGQVRTRRRLARHDTPIARQGR
jgi:hypothetical protein